MVECIAELDLGAKLSPSTGDDAHPGGDDLGADTFEVMATLSIRAASWAATSSR